MKNKVEEGCTSGWRAGKELLHVLPAGHVVGAVRIADAFGLTAGEGVADVVVDAGADGAVVAHLAVGVAAAGRGAAQFLWKGISFV